MIKYNVNALWLLTSNNDNKKKTKKKRRKKTNSQMHHILPQAEATYISFVWIILHFKYIKVVHMYFN